MYAQSTTILLSLTFFLLLKPSTSALDTFIYVGCSQLRYAPGSPYEYNVNSLLTSLANSASFSNFNNFKISLPGSTQSDIIYGLFQCRGDLSTSACQTCVTRAVSRLCAVCPGTTGGTLQLEGCFIKYDNVSFLGVEDKTVVAEKCGPPIGYNSDVLTRRDAVLAYLTAAGQYFMASESGPVQGVAQCTQDLSGEACQDCLTEATYRLRSDCVSAAWGNMFLAKCYARYWESGYHSRSDDGDYGKDDCDNSHRTKTIVISVSVGVGITISFSFIIKFGYKKYLELKVECNNCFTKCDHLPSFKVQSQS